MKNAQYIDSCGLSIAPSDQATDFKISATGIATWYEPQDCARCGGTGIWRGGFTSGVCYGCGGNGKGKRSKVKGYTEAAFATYQKRASAAAKRAAIKYERETAELLESFSAQLDELEAIRDGLRPELTRGFEGRASDFVNKVASALLAYDGESIIDRSRGQIARSWIVKSPKTIVALQKSIEKRKAEDAARSDAPEWENGRFEVSGKVLKTKWTEGAYGSTHKMLLQLEDGRRCWGSVPTKLDAIDQGDEISIKATFEASNDDKKFAFFKRPLLTS